MPSFLVEIPLSLYIHIPWCVRKCPYCDFNSHTAKSDLPESLYVAALLHELDLYLPLIANRPLISIFFGGGTPSLFSGNAIETILNGVNKRIAFASNIEITLEANPGTVDCQRFKDFRSAGVNRLSLGIQSLQNDKLKRLGRIHDKDHAMLAIESAKEAGFDRFNLDLMYGLPDQTFSDAMTDIKTALQFEPRHFSWYQLTIEPNTLFYRHTPTLPEDELIHDMQMAGQALLREAGLAQYEVSAYASQNQACRHNLNYWEFGDYLGIGAGAHSKLTNVNTQQILRYQQVKHPKDYLLKEKREQCTPQVVTEKDCVFEFMLNALRLTEGVSSHLFTQRTGLSIEKLQPMLQKAITRRGLLKEDAERLVATPLGRRFLNDLVTMFL